MASASLLSPARIKDIRASQAQWSELADTYERQAAFTEKMQAERGVHLFDCPTVRRTNARTFRAVVAAYDLEIKTGKPHCSCCMKPLGDTRVVR